jgi:hypothetical protein
MSSIFVGMTALFDKQDLRNRAFFVILWSGESGYVRPFFDGMAASSSASRYTPLRKML